MSENNINISSKIILSLKDELLSDIRHTENKVIDHINKKWCKLEEENNSLLGKLKQMIEDTKQMQDSMTVHQIKIGKMSDYEPFKNKIESMVTTHEIRINTLITDVFNFKTKYDKIISDNLTVPGFIGPSCQYKKISDYLMNNIMELSKTKSEKDQIKSDIKECRSRYDGFLKNMVNLNDSSVLRCNEYTDNKEKNIKEYVNNTFENYEKKNLEMRAGIYDTIQKHFDETKNFMREFDDVLDMKKDINKAIDNKFKEILKEIKKINEKLDEKGKEINNLEKNYQYYNKSLKEITSIVKETQFKETVNQMDIIKINAKFKKGNFIMNHQSNKNMNINNFRNDFINKYNNNDNVINDESYSPSKNIKIPNEGIKMFKDSILKGKSLINRRKTDDLFRLKKVESKESKNSIIFKEKEIQENSEESSIEKEKKGENKLYKELDFKKYSISNEINYTVTSNNDNKDKNKNNDFIINNKNNNNINAMENSLNKDKSENNKTVSSKRSSKSDYKPKVSNQKYLKLLKNNELINNKKKIKIKNKISKIDIIPLDTNKHYRTLNSDGFISSSAKLTNGIKSLTQKYIYNNFLNNGGQNFNYKIVSLSDKISLDSDSKELYALDFETLKKRSIRLNLISPISNPLKTYQNEKNKQNIKNELNIKVSPAFGSTAYSFYQKNNLK